MAFRCFKSMCGNRRSNPANNTSASSDENDQSSCCGFVTEFCCGCVTKFYSSSPSASASANLLSPLLSPTQTKNEGSPFLSPSQTTVADSLSSGISVAAAAESSTSTEFTELCSLLLQQLPRNATDQLMEFIASKLPDDTTRKNMPLDANCRSMEKGFMGKCGAVVEKLLAVACETDLRQIASKFLESLGQAHWMLIGLACIGAALDRMVSMKSNDRNCLHLLKIMNTTAKTLKDLQKHFAEDNKQALKLAFEIIVENSVICFEYLSESKAKKFLKAKTMEQQLQDARDSLNSIINGVHLAAEQEILRITQNLRDMLSYHVIPIADILDCSPVGLDEEIEKVSILLNIDNIKESAVALVIWGMGRIGKSTLAAASIKSLENKLSQKYKYARIEFDNTVKQEKHSHIVELQKQILHFLLQEKTKQIANPENGRHALKEVLQKHSCFLFIDNVNDTEDVNQLLPKNFSLAKGVMLRIIITSRVQEVQDEVPVCCEKKIYERHRLSNRLSEHILKTIVMGPVTEEFREAFTYEMRMLREVAHLCCGIPLLLTVLGGQLCKNRHYNTYNEFIQKLKMGNVNFKGVNYEKIEEILLFAFKKMEISSQEDFTDICCWFLSFELRSYWSFYEGNKHLGRYPFTLLMRITSMKDEKVKEWKYFEWLMGESTMKDMRDKGLVKIEQDGDIVVHDILKSLVKSDDKYILESSEWNQILKDENAEALKELKGLFLFSGTLKCQYLDVAHKSLRHLYLNSVTVADQCINKFGKLKSIWLSGVKSDHFCYKNLASLRNLKSLVIIEAIWLKELPSCNSFPNLSILALFRCPNLKTLPDDIGGLTALKSLKICFCERLTVFPENLEGLKSLQRFEIRQCPIAGLPSGFKLLSSLEICNLEGTGVLPRDFGGLQSLRDLRIDSFSVEELPSSFCRLSLLQICHLIRNEKLRALPQDFGGLQSLRKLRIEFCPVEELPSSFSRLSSLQTCELESTDLKTLPQNFGELPSLQKLRISNCYVEMFPSSFGRLKALQQLSIDECPIKELPANFGELSSLKSCFFEDTKLKKIPSGMCIGLSSLEELHLEGNDELKALPEDFGGLHSLIKLYIQDCPVRELPFTFSQLSSLTSCDLIETELKYLPCGVCSGLSSLQFLTLERNYKMSVLPEDVGGLQSLRYLKIRQCPLRELPFTFSQLSSLTSCDLIETELKYLPCGVCSGLSSLQFLTLERNYKMSVLPEDVGGLQSLRYLIIRQCPLRELPSDLSRLTALDYVELDVKFRSSMKCLLKPKLLCEFCNDAVA